MDNSALSRRIAANAASVAPSDSIDLPTRASGGLWVVATGNVVFVCGSTTVTLTSVPANTLLPFAASRVKATGTTATVVALY